MDSYGLHVFSIASLGHEAASCCHCHTPKISLHCAIRPWWGSWLLHLCILAGSSLIEADLESLSKSWHSGMLTLKLFTYILPLVFTIPGLLCAVGSRPRFMLLGVQDGNESFSARRLSVESVDKIYSRFSLRHSLFSIVLLRGLSLSPKVFVSEVHCLRLLEVRGCTKQPQGEKGRIGGQNCHQMVELALRGGLSDHMAILAIPSLLQLFSLRIASYGGFVCFRAFLVVWFFRLVNV